MNFEFFFTADGKYSSKKKLEPFTSFWAIQAIFQKLIKIHESVEISVDFLAIFLMRNCRNGDVNKFEITLEEYEIHWFQISLIVPGNGFY